MKFSIFKVFVYTPCVSFSLRNPCVSSPHTHTCTHVHIHTTYMYIYRFSQIVVYVEISIEMAEKWTHYRSLAYSVGDLCKHYITLLFLKKVCQNQLAGLSHHLATKKMLFVDGARGKLIRYLHSFSFAPSLIFSWDLHSFNVVSSHFLNLSSPSYSVFLLYPPSLTLTIFLLVCPLLPTLLSVTFLLSPGLSLTLPLPSPSSSHCTHSNSCNNPGDFKTHSTYMALYNYHNCPLGLSQQSCFNLIMA